MAKKSFQSHIIIDFLKPNHPSKQNVHDQWWGKLLLRVMHYYIAFPTKK